MTCEYARGNINQIVPLHGVRKGWFSNTSFITGLKTLLTFRPDALVFSRASGRNIGKVLPEPAEKPSLHSMECQQVEHMPVHIVRDNAIPAI